MKLKIEYVPIESLKTYANNAKIHTAEQIEQIKKSIQEFGMNDPIAVWHDNEIIEGHGRLIALTELGAEEVPIIRLDNLTDEQRRAYMLVHNKLTMNSGFDLGVLEMELESIESVDFSLYGLSVSDIGDMIREVDYSDSVSEPVDSVEVRCPRCGRIVTRKWTN